MAIYAMHASDGSIWQILCRVAINDEAGVIHIDTTDGERLRLAPQGRESYALWVLGINAAMACAAGKAMAAAPVPLIPWVLC